MNGITAAWFRVTDLLENIGAWIGLLGLRILLGWEFYEAGIMKKNGENWFGHIKDDFPFPFNVVPVEISWFLATWFEILGAIGLCLGLFTRFWAFSLVILTIVAIAGVHWPAEWDSLAQLWKGYSVTDNGFGNYRIPLLFLVMLLPLVFRGAGKLSLDHVIARKLGIG